MRLDANQVDAICDEIRRSDPFAESYLYGSRADDASRGGDIDLLVISDERGFRDLFGLRAGILDRIGWQQLDLLVNEVLRSLDRVELQNLPFELVGIGAIRGRK